MNEEIETKLEVPAEGFARLLDACRILKRRDQLNVYYDFGGRLAGLAATFRVRYQEGAQPTLTLKIPVEVRDGRRSAIEVEESLSHRTLPARVLIIDEDLKPDFRPFLRRVGVTRLERLGAMRTCRTTVELPGGVPAELDRVELPDGSVLFEVEIENDDPSCHELAVEDIKNLVPDFIVSRWSKFERFVQAASSVESRRGRAPNPEPDTSGG